MGCGSGSQNSTVTSTTSPPPQVLAAYQALLNQGTAVSQLPLQQYQGPMIAGFNPTQQTAFNEINQAQGSALPYINAAQSYLSAGADDPFSQVETFNPSTLAQYENPYTQQVTQSTQNLLNEQNAEQFNQANASAASAGAFGGDRESVLEAQMAQQQQLAEAPTLAGIQSQGFTTAAGLLGQQQNLQLQGLEGDSWLSENAAAMEGGLGQQAQGSLLSGASSELQAGALGQQLEQEELDVPMEQFAQQQSYPFQTTNFLAGITEGVGPSMGGTNSTTSPGPNLLGQIGGLGLAGLGLYNSGLFSGLSNGATSANALASVEDNYLGAMPQNIVGNIRRGGRVGGFPATARAPGGLVPDLGPNDIADIERAVALASASPVSMPTASPHPLPFSAPTTTQQTSGAGGSNLLGDVTGILGAVRLATMLRHGGRLVPGHRHRGFPRALADGGDGGSNLSDMLIAAGAGMMASRSPFFLSQVGDGLQSALRYGQEQQKLAAGAMRANAPHVDTSGATLRLIYPNGGAFDTGLGTR